MRQMMHRYILDRNGLADGLSFMIADALDGLIPAADWQPLIQESFGGGDKLYEDNLGSAEQLAAADLSAVPERDPSCQDVLTPFLHFKGYKIIQTHRLAHILWR